MSIQFRRCFTNRSALFCSIGCTWVLTARGMGRSMTSARQRSERLLSKVRKASTWHHVPSAVNAWSEPSGLKSMEAGQTRSLVVSPVAGPKSRQSMSGMGRPGRSRACSSCRRSVPSTASAWLRTEARLVAADERRRASFCTAGSALGAPTPKVR